MSGWNRERQGVFLSHPLHRKGAADSMGEQCSESPLTGALARSSIQRALKKIQIRKNKSKPSFVSSVGEVGKHMEYRDAWIYKILQRNYTDKP